MNVQGTKTGVSRAAQMLDGYMAKLSGQVCRERMSHPLDQQQKCGDCGLQFFVMRPPKYRM